MFIAHQNQLNIYLNCFVLVKFSIPGSTFPSSNSNEAPPPVLTWLTLLLAFQSFTKAPVSPPPIIVVVPFYVALIKDFNIPLLP